jgi:hypothetical protein
MVCASVVEPVMEYWTPTPQPEKKNKRNKAAMDNTRLTAATGTGIN